MKATIEVIPILQTVTADDGQPYFEHAPVEEEIVIPHIARYKRCEFRMWDKEKGEVTETLTGSIVELANGSALCTKLTREQVRRLVKACYE
jgi:hypothetical protein